MPRPNGDATPCPYLPAFGGNLREQGLSEIWRESELFTKIRQRTQLGGRCGDCEFNSHCGGCRARAYGVTGDMMAEDPLCTHTPGTYTVQSIETPAVEYGAAATQSIEWDEDARKRMKQVPAFVRGMVTRAVEGHCEKEGVSRVTLEVLERIRSRMPTPKIFRRPGSGAPD